MNQLAKPSNSRLKATAILASFLTAGAFAVVTAEPAFAANVTVCSSGCDYTTIQDAVDNANDGDIIQIAAGTYNESVQLNKSLTLQGPNSAISPNSSDPLVANSARVAEAIINPPSGDQISGIDLGAAALNVTITGLTIDMTGSVGYNPPTTTSGQSFIRGLNIPANGTLTLTNNIFTEGDWAVEGKIVYKTTHGNTTVTVNNNRFTNSAVSNGMFLNNSSPAAVMTLNITNNVWLNNGYLAGNFSTDNATVIQGSIENNWVGNSTPGTSGVDAYDTRQAGFLFAGNWDGFNVKNNTFKDIEDVGIYFWNGFNGTLNITDNEFDGYSNVSGRALVLTRAGAPLSDVSNVVFTNNSITNPTAGSFAVLNQSDTGILDARGNWWGSPTPNFDDLVNIPNVGHTSYTVLVDDWLTSWGEPNLAETGSELAAPLFAGGLLLLFAGGGIVFLTRRKSRQV